MKPQKPKQPLLVSACLLGQPVRYDGKSKHYPDIEKLRAKYDLIPICPELFAGLGTPRPAHEIRDGRAIDINGKDITMDSLRGAEAVLKIADTRGAKLAIMKGHSPSCGTGQIYDGTFTGKLTNGNGIAAQLLIDMGITVISEDDIDSLLAEI
ncbi:MAG: DUF523 domain-containing protein [Firmicutes bacterium]|nr:DUF523 domain-containing protein [Bacillota bacterium]